MMDSQMRNARNKPRTRLYLEGKYWEGRVVRVTAVVDRVSPNGVLLRDILVHSCVEDHVWLKEKDAFSRCRVGEKVTFRADVVRYRRGDGTDDYGLKNPFAVRRLVRE